jgi:hypothetical protein
MVCITTNESLSDVHHALRRPGRCLANIHIGYLSAREANGLLPADQHIDRPRTLAEVLECRGDLSMLGATEETPAPGAYM